MRIHHIGYLVKHIEAARERFEELGYNLKTDVVKDKERGVLICFIEKDGYLIELVSPAGEGSSVKSLIKRYGNTPYHICYQADDFDRDLSELEAGGFLRIDSPSPAPAIEGRKVCFLQNSQIGMVELLM
ncbi:MAG: VOC family protein [Oscillospiraceae bacterium]|nr:VOC family protein [Oscillospiraceae bacterium]